MVSATLIACKGARRVTWEELAAMPAPTPASKVHAPVQHADLVAKVENSLRQAGYEVQDRQFAVQKANNQLFATFLLCSEVTQHAVLAVGLRSSYDCTLPLGLVAGTHTTVCSNLMFRSDLINVRRKHTVGNVHKGVFVREVQAALSKLASFQEVEAARLQAMSAQVLSQDAAYALILRAGLQGIVTQRLLPSVVKAYDTPPHDHGPPSLYALMQAFTYALKSAYERNPVTFASSTMRLARLLSPTEGGPGGSAPAIPVLALAS